MNSTTNDDDNANDDMTWKVVRTWKSNTSLWQPKHLEQGQSNRNKREQVKRKNGSDQDDGGFRAKVYSGTVEVRFMIYQRKRTSFNLCIRLREFIVEAQTMDTSFRIIQLEGDEGECISSAEDWPNNKDGIDKFYRHQSRANNESGKMRIITKLSLAQLKTHTGTFITYLRRKGVHINYAQLGIFDTVTLEWVAGAHPSYSYRDEMKDRMEKLMAGEHKSVQYALFPRAFHYINNKNKRLSTRGVAIQIMKNDDVSPAQFREDMVKIWQRIEESSGNPLANQYFVPVGREADLGTTAMTKICHVQNHFLRSTKMKLVHNLGDMDEVLDLELSEHVDISDEYITLRNILRSFKVKNIPVIRCVENTNTLGTYRFLYDESMEKYMADLLSNLDPHIKDIGEWDDCNGQHRYNTMEQVTPDNAMRYTKNSGFWKSYAATIDSSTKYLLPCTYVILNKPPPSRTRMPISYSAVVQKVTTRNSKQSQNLDDPCVRDFSVIAPIMM
jgi:hypothetical protein